MNNKISGTSNRIKSNNMDKSISKRKFKLRIKIYLTTICTLLIFSIFYILPVVSNVYETKTLLEQKEYELKQEQERKTTLENDLLKIENEGYIDQYIRDNYYFTSDDEILFLLPKE